MAIFLRKGWVLVKRAGFGEQISGKQAKHSFILS